VSWNVRIKFSLIIILVVPIAAYVLANSVIPLGRNTLRFPWVRAIECPKAIPLFSQFYKVVFTTEIKKNKQFPNLQYICNTL